MTIVTKLRTWTITLTSSRSDGKVAGRLYLTLQAATRHEAEAMVRESLPGFDWQQWVSSWGITEVDDD